MDEKRSRRRFLAHATLWTSSLAAASTTGCTTWFAEPPTPMAQKALEIKDLLNSSERPQLVADVAVSHGLYTRRFDSFGLVNHLSGTGGDVSNGPQRDAILKEMRAEGVPRPKEHLADKGTALVKTKAYAPPGLQEGERVDVVVECSSECNATSLQNGFLLPSRLQEFQVLKNSLKSSHDKAKATGPIVMIPRSLNESAKPEPLKGVILGGAKILDTRTVGLRIRKDFAHVMTTSAIAKSINERFEIMEGNNRDEVAEAKNDGEISLRLHPKYRQDPQHFLQVVQSIGFLESDSARSARISECRQNLLSQTTCNAAALQLEAIGSDAIEILALGVNSADSEVKFRSAYALAYLDSELSIAALTELAMKEPAMRPLCLVGLSINQAETAKDALETLLQYPDAEVRYGALIALRKRDRTNAFVTGSRIGNVAKLIEIPSESTGIAVSLEESPEIIVFGHNPILKLEQMMEINPSLRIQASGPISMKLTAAAEYGTSQTLIVPSDLRSILFGIEELGGTYNDIVQFLDMAALSGDLPYPLALNPRPHSGRVFKRNAEDEKLDDADRNSMAEKLSESKVSSPEEINDSKRTYPWWDMRRIVFYD